MSKKAVGDIMDCKNYSTMSRLLRVTAHVLRAVKRFKVSSSTRDHSMVLTIEELAAAETVDYPCSSTANL